MRGRAPEREVPTSKHRSQRYVCVCVVVCVWLCVCGCVRERDREREKTGHSAILLCMFMLQMWLKVAYYYTHAIVYICILQMHYLAHTQTSIYRAVY